MFDDQIRQIGFHDDLPSPRQLDSVRVDKDREPASDDDESQIDDLANSSEWTFPAQKTINDPAHPSQNQRPQSSEKTTMQVRPNNGNGNEPQESTNADSAHFEITQESKHHRNENDRRDMRANVKMRRAGGDREHQNHAGQSPVQSLPNQSVSEPGIQSRQDGRGREQQA